MKSFAYCFRQAWARDLRHKRIGDAIKFPSGIGGTYDARVVHRSMCSHGVILLVKQDGSAYVEALYLSEEGNSGLLMLYPQKAMGTSIIRGIDPDYERALKEYEAPLADSELDEANFSSGDFLSA